MRGFQTSIFAIRPRPARTPVGRGTIYGRYNGRWLVQLDGKPTTPCGITIVHAVPRELVEVVRS